MPLKSFLKRVVGKKDKNRHPIDALKASGNLVHGTNCDLSNLSVAIQGQKAGRLNIQIGNDCSLACSILLQTPDAQVIIGDGVFIGPETTLFCYEKITFGNDIMVSWGCTFIDTNAHSLIAAERMPDVRDWIKGPEHKNWGVVKNAQVQIKDKCWVGFNCIIGKGVIMEEGTVLGFGSVLTKSTAPYGIYGGNPAAFIKKTS